MLHRKTSFSVFLFSFGLILMTVSAHSVEAAPYNASFISTVYTAAVGLDWSLSGVGDFNADGKADILWRNNSTGVFTEWQSTGNSFAQNVYMDGTVDTTWHINAIGDFNGDDKAEKLPKEGLHVKQLNYDYVCRYG